MRVSEPRLSTLSEIYMEVELLVIRRVCVHFLGNRRMVFPSGRSIALLPAAHQVSSVSTSSPALAVFPWFGV